MLLQNGKLFVLQNGASGITKKGRYYRMAQFLLQNERGSIPKWGNHYKEEKDSTKGFWQLSFRATPNGHTFVDSPSIRRQISAWKVRENYIDFERRIHVEIVISIRRGYFDVDSTVQIDEIPMSSPRGFFYVVSTSNRLLQSLFAFSHFLTFSALGTYSNLF